MKRNKIKYIVIGLIVIIIIGVNFFNISLTSLPTSFPNMIKEHTANGEFEQIEKIKVRKGYVYDEKKGMVNKPKDLREFTIDDKDEIYDLLNTDTRVYNGGRIERGSEKYWLTLYFKNGNEHEYTIGESYIFASRTNKEKKRNYYKVLDDDNKVFDYFESLYSGE